MAVNPNKIQVYLKEDIKKALHDYRTAKGIDSDSQAVNQLLGLFFELQNDTKNLGYVTIDDYRETTKRLENQIDLLHYKYLELLKVLKETTAKTTQQLSMTTNDIEDHAPTKDNLTTTNEDKTIEDYPEITSDGNRNETTTNDYAKTTNDAQSNLENDPQDDIENAATIEALHILQDNIENAVTTEEDKTISSLNDSIETTLNTEPEDEAKDEVETETSDQNEPVSPMPQIEVVEIKGESLNTDQLAKKYKTKRQTIEKARDDGTLEEKFNHKYQKIPYGKTFRYRYYPI